MAFAHTRACARSMVFDGRAASSCGCCSGTKSRGKDDDGEGVLNVTRSVLWQVASKVEALISLIMWKTISVMEIK